MGWLDRGVVFKVLKDLPYSFSWHLPLVPLLTPAIICFLIIMSFAARCEIQSMTCICLMMEMLRKTFVYLWIFFMALENCPFNVFNWITYLVFVCFGLLSCNTPFLSLLAKGAWGHRVSLCRGIAVASLELVV